MPTVSVYMNDEDYQYYKSLDKKSAVLRWALEQHRKAFEKKVQDEEPKYTTAEPSV